MVERLYNIPLRREWLKAPKWRRSKKAISALQAYLVQHTKVSDVKLSKWINETVWAKGSKNPPARLSVKVDIDKDKGIARAELAELPAAANRLAVRKKKQEEKAKKVEEKKLKPEAPAETEAKEEKAEMQKGAMTPQQEAAMHKK